MPRTLIRTSLLFILIATFFGCDRSMTDDELRENVQKQRAVMSELASILDKIDTVDSASIAKPKLENRRDRWVELLTEMKERHGDRGAESLPVILGSEEYGELETITNRFSRSYERVLAQPELKNAIGDSFEIQGLLPPGDASVPNG